jgi:outer membrane lipoprotein-sorting protein
MHRFKAAFCALLSVVFLTGAGQAPPPRRIEFTAEQQAALDKVSIYLNGIHSLKSDFMQLGPDGQLDQGEFLLEKPGQLRFEYNPPSATLIVANGGKVYVQNKKLNTVDRYDLSDTPLGLLLDDKLNLKANSAITGIDIHNDDLVVHARTSNNRQQGNIAMVFSYPQIELRQWTIKDNQGGTTMVALHNPQPGATIDPVMFNPPVKAPVAKKAG